ncbi:MAG TPA: acylphosphatase [Gemmatimonadaceae bacterium]|nr:acylphosphatase [Gemmatimonadaceae bacterium]
MASLHVQVKGRVQGVGFRWFVRVSGRRLQLSGWVKNRPDGSVEVAASGSEDRLAELRKLVHRGPDGAEVAEVVDLEEISNDLDYPFAMKK